MSVEMKANPKEYFYEKWVDEHLRVQELEDFVRLVANGKRPDGSIIIAERHWNKKQRNY